MMSLRSRSIFAGKWTTPWQIMVVLCLTDVVQCHLCRGPVCEYKFVFRRTRTMTYADGKNVFNVALNGSRLQSVENLYRTKDEYPDHIGQFVNGSDVITADGVRRNVILINDQFPGPTIEVMEGVQVVVHVTNHLLLQGTTLHFHGMYQKGTPWMDGVGYVAQCPILPRQTFTYRFEARPSGTHWYHGDFENQRIDGLYGMIIVHSQPPTTPSFPLLISDWYDEDAANMELLNPYGAGIHRGTGDNVNPTELRPVMAAGATVTSLRFVSSLINGRGRRHGESLPLETFSVVRENRYRFRMANTGDAFPYEVRVDSHVLTVVATDGYDITPHQVDIISIYPGETVDFEISTNQTPGKYWVRANTPISRPRHGGKLESIPEEDAKAVLLYDGIESDGDPQSTMSHGTPQQPLIVFNCPFANYPAYTNRSCVTFSDMKSREPKREEHGLADDDVIEHFLNFGFGVGSSINNRRFVGPSVPFYQDYVPSSRPCSGENCSSGCTCTNVLELPYNRTVQLVMLNYSPQADVENHQINIHGHDFSVIRIGYPEINITTDSWIGNNDDIECDDKLCAQAHWRDGVVPALNLRDPPVRDVVTVPARGYAVIRFRTLNPGFWYMHCYTSILAQEGMSLVINEAPERHPPLPAGFPTCGNYDIGADGYNKAIDSPVTPIPVADTAPGDCPLRVVEGNDRQFMLGSFTVDCAPGTMYNRGLCTCVRY